MAVRAVAAAFARAVGRPRNREPATVIRSAGRRQSPDRAGRGACARARRRAACPKPATQTGSDTMSVANIPIPRECRKLVRLGALVAINYSGGKDSQCMTILLSRLVPREQLLVVHAPLGEVRRRRYPDRPGKAVEPPTGSVKGKQTGDTRSREMVSPSRSAHRWLLNG